MKPGSLHAVGLAEVPRACHCGKLIRRARDGELHDECAACRGTHNVPAPDPLAKLRASLLAKADTLQRNADQIGRRISDLHRRSSAMLDAAEKLRAIAKAQP